MSFFAGFFLATALNIVAVPTAPAIRSKAPFARASAQGTPLGHKIYGFVQSLSGSTLVILNRSGHSVVVDGRFARSEVHFYRDRPVIVYGTADASGVVHATAVWRTYPDASHWPPDR